MDIGDLGKFKIGGSINTQFQTGLGIERILMGLGQQATGITSLLMTLEFFGFIILIFWSLFFITLIITIHILLFIIGIYKSITGHKGRMETITNSMSDEEIAAGLKKFEISDNDVEQLKNFH